jgi:phosphorylase kinase alpha/beta subunit
MSKPSIDQLTATLDEWFSLTDKTILSRQDPKTGLFPASTDVNGHGDYTDAWVRDNVYSILAIWGLWLGYRKFDHFPARTSQLQQSVIRLMRGLLTSMMRQTHKVERFKYTQNPLDALHAKYDTQSGSVVVDDDKWGHLQLDATSIFVLMLSQMTKSGLEIIETIDEVNFVQNLVWYIGRGYRTPDYGIWERGNKINNGRVEINASSVGMVKSALEAIRGMNLLPKQEGNVGLIHVMADEISRCRTTLESLLPRESLSKEVDAACLSVIGYPAFAIEDTNLIQKTRDHILEKLSGPYGCKRFLLDGHQTVLEDHHRLHYEMNELKNFEHIESEWPLFYAFLFLESLFVGDQSEIDRYRTLLDGLRVEKDGMWLLPELYYVAAEHVDAEKENPGSQPRLPNNNVPLVWTQSLYTLGCLVHDEILSIEDIDPLNHHQRIGLKTEPTLAIVLLAENEQVHRYLEQNGIVSQTITDIEPIRVFPASELSRVFHVVGQNQPQGLSGRPQRNPRSLSTARIYELGGEVAVFLPQFMNRDRFYLSTDSSLLAEQIKSEMAYIARHWLDEKDPVLVLDITSAMIDAKGFDKVADLLHEIQDGRVKRIATRNIKLLDDLANLAKERIYELHDYQTPRDSIRLGRRRKKWLKFSVDETQPIAESVLALLKPERETDELIEDLKSTSNLYVQNDILKSLVAKHGLDYESGLAPLVTLRLLVTEIYETASDQLLWSIVRSTAGLLGKYWSGLEDSVSEILSRQRIIIVGRAFSDQGTISSPKQNKEILELINQNTAQDPREAILNQEILIMIASLMRGDPDLLKGMKSVRPGHLAMLMMGQLADEMQLEPDKAFEVLVGSSPFELQSRIRLILGHYQEELDRLFATESLHSQNELLTLSAESSEQKQVDKLGSARNWLQWREQQGVMPRLPEGFYENLWSLLTQCKGVVVGDRFDSRSRLDSSSVLDSMTSGEPQFAVIIERLLNKIQSPSYRQMTIEALSAIMAIAKLNPNLKLEDYLIVEVIIAHAVRLNWIGQYPAQVSNYNSYRGQAWQAFYQNPPIRIAQRIHEAMNYLIQQGHRGQMSDGGIGESV